LTDLVEYNIRTIDTSTEINDLLLLLGNVFDFYFFEDDVNVQITDNVER